MFADDLLQFVEALVEQMLNVKVILDFFCAAFGQKVSSVKIVIFFSRNVQDFERIEIGQVGGFHATDSLDKNLGGPLLMGGLHGIIFITSFLVFRST